MNFNWREEKLSKIHKREEFDCGNAQLNDFLSKYARQSHERSTSKTYVAIDNNSEQILGFYTITLNAISPKTLPNTLAKRLGSHQIPLFTLARLAVAKNVQGYGLGGQLLLKAAQRCMLVAEQVGGVGLFIEAKDQNVANWYRSFGAIPLIDQPLSLILPFNTIKQLF
ncbi:N-acetyltransferase [[Haemophilus] felis]|uniref:GNAT family acetyltransferase n=1 Tax=[Haemophilus] felis TaxID=123822 RepID=A0A1T0B078_9PAST|nr:N-acetyltransferase [[Haemophilus] felis]OOS03472.1 GNAT family acetyltransferase [[Haemophilus] felis]